MKKILLFCVTMIMLLSGCGGPEASDEPCTYCGKKPAYVYEPDGRDISLCKDCYKTEDEMAKQDKINLKNGKN